MESVTTLTLTVCLALVVHQTSAAAVSPEQFGQDLIDFLNEELGNDHGGSHGNTNDVYYGKRDSDPCDPDPCENDATCTTSEQPLLGIGIESYCLCQSQVLDDGTRINYGGYYCQIESPCDNCPSDTFYCVSTNMDSDGKFCYDSDFSIIDETAEIPVVTSRGMKRTYQGLEDFE